MLRPRKNILQSVCVAILSLILLSLRFQQKLYNIWKKGQNTTHILKKTNFENLVLFDKEFALIINRLLQWIVPKNKLIDSRQIVNSLNSLKQHFLSVGPAQNSKLITVLLHRYVSERKRYKTDLRNDI